jgi:uncharacterized damage-inducible protein DinB
MSLTDTLIQELDTEATTTRRVLERVPDGRLGWKPHTKSMSLGQLAMHVARIPGFITEWALQDTIEAPSGEGGGEAKSCAELLAAHDQSITKAKAALKSLGDAGLQRTWSMTHKGTPLMTMPKVALVRGIALNHWYHHRGQLSVYLRLLDTPVPSIYGPSADENPMASRG